jgi:hypothetical protein
MEGAKYGLDCSKLISIKCLSVCIYNLETEEYEVSIAH